jgi:uncharacterized membrane protein
VFDALFRLLFKYRTEVYLRGDFVFEAPGGLRLFAILLGGVAAAAVLTYASARARTTPRDRGILAALRLGVVAVVCFSLLRPAMVVQSTVPERSFVAVVFDDSRSMVLPDRSGAPRGIPAVEPFREGSPVRASLEARFGVRTFAFSRGLERIAGPEALSFEGTTTRIGPALERVREELAGVPLAGIILVSDGGDTSGEELTRTLLPLRAAGVPVFPVVAGDPTPIPDIQITRVELPFEARRGTSIEADVVIRQSGFGGIETELVVEDRGRILATRPVTLPPDGASSSVSIRFSVDDVGARDLRFRIPVQGEERIEENNGLDRLIRVEDRFDRILYLEGEPRHEVAFLRRAVAEDRSLEVVLLQRSYQDRFLRLNVEDADELATGFPRTRAELFQFKGLVLGSVEASFFTPDQLQMIADFVGVRGGGLLALGGRNALAQGGYAGTAVDPVLPVVLDAPPGGADAAWGEVKVRPTRAGLAHGAIQIGDTEEASAARWETLPPLSTFNPMPRAKPGATVLLTGSGPTFREDPIVLAMQRFGRGKALALPVADLWMWRMHADVPLEDETHQTLWRQLLRFTVDGVPDPVSVRAVAETVEPGIPAELRAVVLDSAFLAVNGARVQGTVTAPDGTELEVTFDPSPREDGAYSTFFTPTLDGVHDVRLEAFRDGVSLGVAETNLRVAPLDVETRDPAVRMGLLRRIADETGGRLHTVNSLETLAEDITLAGGGIRSPVSYPLWDLPLLLLLILGLLGGEWILRRTRGLA